MKVDNEQIELAMAEIGSAVLRLQRAGLSESASHILVKRLVEMEEVPVSADEGMWTEGEPAGDSSADAVKETDSGPETERSPSTEKDPKPWHADKGDGDGDKDDSPDTVKYGEEKNESVEVTGFDRFMDPILMSEGRKENAKNVNLPDSPGMQHARRYGEKAHNRITWKK